jgi:hypothetical protein
MPRHIQLKFKVKEELIMNNIEKLFKIEISQQFVLRMLLLLLNIGTKAASFHTEGKVPFSKLRLHMYLRADVNVSEQLLIIKLRQWTSRPKAVNCPMNVIRNGRNIYKAGKGSLRSAMNTDRRERIKSISKVKNPIFWDVMLYSPAKVNRNFRRLLSDYTALHPRKYKTSK